MKIWNRKTKVRFRKARNRIPKFRIFVIFLVGLGLLFYANKTDLSIGKRDFSDVPAYEYTKYYAAITHYTNESRGVGFENLRTNLTDSSAAKIIISEEEKENLKKMFDIQEYSSNVTFAKNSEIISKVVGKEANIAIIPADVVNFKVKTLEIDDKFLWDKNTVNYPLKVKLETEDRSLAVTNFEQTSITKLTSIGDVILGRHVAYKMNYYDDYTHPWLLMADFIKNADITFADLEVPLSDQVSPPYEGMSFVAPQESIAGLKLAGIDIVALANNHSTNFGTEVFTDTLTLLNDEGIKYCGGGENSQEAYAPTIIEANNLKFAFLDYNSIIGAINATDDSPGVAKFDIKPWSDTDSVEDLAVIKNAVQEAKTKADIVVVQFHWGVEYESSPIQSQINVAHAAIDSGADLIIGTHPHVVQGMENYNNIPVFYSLGNFIFDQEWSIETKQGVVAETYFYGKKIVSAPITPYQIEDYNQPHLATVEQSTQILKRLFGASLTSEFQ